MRIKGLQAFLHAGVVDAQELVLGGSHVNEIWLAFCTFLIEELVDRLICWRLFQVSTDDLIERFAQMRRASFCSKVAAQWRRGELTAVQTMKRLGISKATFYRRVASGR